jgi:hypothetical protein
MHGCIDGREHPRHGVAMDSLLEAAGVFRLDATVVGTWPCSTAPEVSPVLCREHHPR